MILCAQTAAAVILAAFVMPSACLVPGSRVRVLNSETLFREAFSRFPYNELNGYSAAKLDRLGQEADILAVYHDQTATCVFDDGVRHAMPIEAFSVPTQTSDGETGHVGRVGPSTQGAVDVPSHPLPSLKTSSGPHVGDGGMCDVDLLNCDDDWFRSKCPAACAARFESETPSPAVCDVLVTPVPKDAPAPIPERSPPLDKISGLEADWASGFTIERGVVVYANVVARGGNLHYKLGDGLPRPQVSYFDVGGKPRSTVEPFLMTIHASNTAPPEDVRPRARAIGTVLVVDVGDVDNNLGHWFMRAIRVPHYHDALGEISQIVVLKTLSIHQVHVELLKLAFRKQGWHVPIGLMRFDHKLFEGRIECST